MPSTHACLHKSDGWDTSKHFASIIYYQFEEMNGILEEIFCDKSAPF